MRVSFWALQCGGWLGLGLVAILGSIPLHEGGWIYLYWALFTCFGFAGSLLLRVMCRALLRSGAGWVRFAVLVAVTSYLLAFVCSLATVFLERAIRGQVAAALRWDQLFAAATGDALAGFIIFIAWCGIYFGVKQWQAAAMQQTRVLALEKMAREAELRALRYQIAPHFLFNTLNGISTLVGEGEADAAREMIALLGEFLRTALDGQQQGDVTLREELRHMEQYLAIEQVRLGDRLHVSVAFDSEVGDALVPNLLLQPLIENAIRHGIAQRVRAGRLEIAARREGMGPVAIAVMNSLGEPGNGSAGSGMGLANTRERLRVRFRGEASVEAGQQEGGQWHVTLRFPFETTGAR